MVSTASIRLEYRHTERFLPTGHVYCSECLATQVDAGAQNNTFPCPICRVDFNTGKQIPFGFNYSAYRCAPYQSAAPNLALIPQKYHQYILPVTRRLYIENANQNEATDELKRELAEAEERIQAVQTDLQTLRNNHRQLQVGYRNLLAGHQNLQANHAALTTSHQGLQGRYQQGAVQIDTLKRRLAVRETEAIDLRKLHEEEIQIHVDAHDDTTRRLQWAEEQTQIYKDKYTDLSSQLSRPVPEELVFRPYPDQLPF